MKKILSVMIILIAVVLVSSCNKKIKKEVDRLNTERDSLMALAIEKDTFTMSYVNAFNSIQANLDSIRQKEKLISEITTGRIENPGRLEEDINRDIDAIYELLVKNREIVDNLRYQLKGTRNDKADLEKMILNLTQQNEAKDAEITLLREELAAKKITISDLEKNLADMASKGRAKQATIDAQIKALNKVWYIVGTKKNLQEINILTKEGGFIGLGKTRKVSENFDKSLFTEADLRELKSITLLSKKAKLVTVHPAGSYEISGYKTADSLLIKHPDDFWSAPRYLVVMLD